MEALLEANHVADDRAMPLHMEDNQDAILSRYETAYNLLINRLGWSPDHVDGSWGIAAKAHVVTGNVSPDQSGDAALQLVDWACWYALQPNVFSVKMQQLGSGSLDRALLVGTTLGYYVQPPDFPHCDNDPVCGDHEELFHAINMCNFLATVMFLASVILSVGVWSPCLSSYARTPSPTLSRYG
jgi:hypothetical protein